MYTLSAPGLIDLKKTKGIKPRNNLGPHKTTTPDTKIMTFININLIVHSSSCGFFFHKWKSNDRFIKCRQSKCETAHNTLLWGEGFNSLTFSISFKLCPISRIFRIKKIQVLFPGFFFYQDQNSLPFPRILEMGLVFYFDEKSWKRILNFLILKILEIWSDA